MNELHLFAGAGGGILGGMLLGHTCVCAVEIEHYRRKILIERQRDGILPHFPIWDEIKTFDGRPWKGIVETVCGGFPCQDISARGTGKGIAGEKSGLWSEMRRIIFEILPRYVFVENSPLLIKRGLAIVLGDLASMGYDAKLNHFCYSIHRRDLEHSPRFREWLMDWPENWTELKHSEPDKFQQWLDSHGKH
jgi:DNA (cytosine-5)-methyltransferase 1